MTEGAHRKPTARVWDTVWYWITATLTVVGIAAVATGTWLEYGPDDGTLTLFVWTWDVADISDVWAPWLMIGGGLLASISMGWEIALARVESSSWLTVFEGLILLAGIAAVVVGVVLLL